MSTVPTYLLLSRHSVYYFRIVVPDVIRPLFHRREIRRSLQTRCRREALIRRRELLLQVQRLFTEAFKPSVERLRGAWESGGKRVASWALWLRQQQLESLSSSVLPALPERSIIVRTALSLVVFTGTSRRSSLLLSVLEALLKSREQRAFSVCGS